MQDNFPLVDLDELNIGGEMEIPYEPLINNEDDFVANIPMPPPAPVLSIRRNLFSNNPRLALLFPRTNRTLSMRRESALYRIVNPQPATIDYSIKVNRVNSFDSFPRYFLEFCGLTKEVMANAGLVYKNFSDYVR